MCKGYDTFLGAQNKHPCLTHPVKTLPGGPRWKIDPLNPTPVGPGEFPIVFLDPGENPF